MVLLFSGIAPAGQSIAVNGAYGTFTLRLYNTSNEHLQVTIKTLPAGAPPSPADCDDEEPDLIPPHDYLPRGFL
jgi:hypothetical protein